MASLRLCLVIIASSGTVALAKAREGTATPRTSWNIRPVALEAQASAGFVAVQVDLAETQAEISPHHTAVLDVGARR